MILVHATSSDSANHLAFEEKSFNTTRETILCNTRTRAKCCSIRIVLSPTLPMPELNPQQAYQVALEHHQAGRLAEAEALYRQILAVMPNQPETLNMLGILAGQVGRHEAAADLFRLAVAQRPDWPEALCNLGEALRLTGQLDAAFTALNKAIALAPKYIVAYGNLSLVLIQGERWEEAIKICRQGLELQPTYGVLYKNLGLALTQAGMLQDAIEMYRRAIALQAADVVMRNDLGIALSKAGQVEQAIEQFREAIAIQPDFLLAYNNLGVAWCGLKKWPEAIDAFRQALARQPAYIDAQHNLGKALFHHGQLDESTAVYRQVLALQPDHADACANLGMNLRLAGQLDAALAAHRRAAELLPSNAHYHGNVLFTLHYHPAADAAAIATEHRVWAQQHAEPLRPLIQPHKNDPMPERRLRIGYVSADFREHAVARLLLPLLANHDRRSFEIFAYADVPSPDRITEQMQGLTDIWRSTVGLTDQQLADLIRADQIDILVDLAGHTAHNRLLVFAQKPAPVQVTGLGYPDTTGLSTIDYRLTDALADPLGQTEEWHSEQLVRIPDSGWCIELAEQQIPRARSAGPITFGCFNNMAKVTEPMLRLWAQILQQVPDARLLLKSEGMASAECRARVQKILEAQGIAASRLYLRRPDKKYGGHLEQYHEMDIALDPFPYHGTVSTCEALWQGVPVVTLAGKSHVSRVGVSLLTNVGLPELVAATPEDYIRLAVELANDLPRLQELRSTLRGRMQAAPLRDGSQYARKIEATYRQMWRKWGESSRT